MPQPACQPARLHRQSNNNANFAPAGLAQAEQDTVEIYDVNIIDVTSRLLPRGLSR